MKVTIEYINGDALEYELPNVEAGDKEFEIGVKKFLVTTPVLLLKDSIYKSDMIVKISRAS